MPLSPVQIKEKLLKGIDSDNNVINPSIVAEVIGLLERTVLTRNDLEVTRLGLLINQIRKKSSDKDVAKRCYRLVKSWQQLVNSSASNHSSPAAGYSPALSRNPNLTCPSPKLASHSSSPNLQIHSKLASPSVTHGRIASPAGRTVSPLVRQPTGGTNGSAAAAGVKRAPISPAAAVYGSNKRISPSNSRLTPPSSQTWHQSASSPNLPAVAASLNQLAAGSSRPNTPTNNNHSANTDSTSRAHVANKKRRRSDESIGSDASSIKRHKTVTNGITSECVKPSERTKTPRVKTTVQLIAELQNSGSNLSASDTITKIVTNQIEKEQDDINVSVVPASAKPRPRRKNGSLANPVPPEAPNDMSITKSDLVHRFLQTAAAGRNSGLSSAADSVTEDADVDIMAVDTAATPAKPAVDMTIDPYSLLPPLDLDTITWSDDEDDAYTKPKRNPITGEYPDGVDPASVNEDDDDDIARIYGVARILNEDWPGVNGSAAAAASREFHEWTDTLVIKPSESDKDDVYVLPYVDL